MPPKKPMTKNYLRKYLLALGERSDIEGYLVLNNSGPSEIVWRYSHAEIGENFRDYLIGVPPTRKKIIPFKILAGEIEIDLWP